jgi:hypothetical protein
VLAVGRVEAAVRAAPPPPPPPAPLTAHRPLRCATRNGARRRTCPSPTCGPSPEARPTRRARATRQRRRWSSRWRRRWRRCSCPTTSSRRRTAPHRGRRRAFPGARSPSAARLEGRLERVLAAKRFARDSRSAAPRRVP